MGNLMPMVCTAFEGATARTASSPTGVPSEQAGSPGARLECRFDGLRQDDAFSAVYQPVRPCTAAEQRLKNVRSSHLLRVFLAQLLDF